MKLPFFIALWLCVTPIVGYPQGVPTRTFGDSARSAPRTWQAAIDYVGRSNGIISDAPPIHERGLCPRRTEAPDSVAILGKELIELYSRANYSHSWDSPADASKSANMPLWTFLATGAITDTLRAQVWNVSCYANEIVLKRGDYYFRIQGQFMPVESDFSEAASAGRLFVIASDGHMEPLILRKAGPDDLAIRITTARPYIDSLRSVSAAEDRNYARAVAQSTASRRARINAKPWSRATKELVLAHKISIGMTRDQVLESLGQPQDDNRTVVPGSVHEQWVYGVGLYVYIDDGIVTGWQN